MRLEIFNLVNHKEFSCLFQAQKNFAAGKEICGYCFRTRVQYVTVTQAMKMSAGINTIIRFPVNHADGILF